MRHLTWMLFLLACGSESAGPADLEMDGDASSADPRITYPDSYCDEQGCTKGACDPSHADPELVDCNAWQIIGRFGLSAVTIDAQAERGPGPAPTGKSDSDTCPGSSQTPEGITGPHCCQRVRNQGEQPAYKLTGLEMMTPPVFGNGSVAATNRSAIEQDRYNWIMQLDTNEVGEVRITSGLGLTNVDGSYAFARGAFSQGGKTWNEDGVWDAHVIPGELAQHDDGTFALGYREQYVPEQLGRSFQLPMWGEGLDFAMLVLAMTGITMQVDTDPTLTCAGYIDPNVAGKFDLIGELEAYLPLAALRNTVLHLSKGDSGVPLCMLTAQVKDCSGPVGEWQSSR